jgi:hypothetical protein
VPLRLASVPAEVGVAGQAVLAEAGNTQAVLPDSWMVTSTLPQKLASVPLKEPLLDWLQVPAVSVKPLAAIVPLSVMVTVVEIGVPGTALVLPPYLLMVLQVALLLVTVEPLETQVFAPEDSVMISAPLPTVLTLLVIEAVKPEITAIEEPAMSTDPTPAAISAPVGTAANRRRSRDRRPIV